MYFRVPVSLFYVPFQTCYAKRHEAMKKIRADMLAKKEEDIAKKRARDLRRKEELSAEIVQYGLWSAGEVEVKIAALTGIAAQRAALRAQLLFRRHVLGQKAAPSLFALSKSGKLLPISELIANLRMLLPSQASVDSDSHEPLEAASVEPAPKRSLAPEDVIQIQ